MRGYFHSTLDVKRLLMKKKRDFLFSILWHVSKLVYPENFPSTKFGTNDGYFFKKTADQTLVTEAHVDLDDKWRGGKGGGEEQGREVNSSFRFFNYKVLKR